jgi:DNA-binding IscR family transcriptional regulator
MLKDGKKIEYALEVIRAFHHNNAEYDSTDVYTLVKNAGRIVNPSKSYLQKVLPKMVKSGILLSSDQGYTMAHELEGITADKVLSLCDLPEEDSPIYNLCVELKEGVSLSGIKEFYDFS